MLEPGIILGGVYRLERLLGKGGMGEVWLANHALLQQYRAIKLLLGEFVSDARLRERFIQGEARNALRLEQHVGIVRTYELGLHENMPYLVMEYVEGGPLGATLKEILRARGRFGLDEAGWLLERMAAALDAAHRQGVIHRDIKPANILLDQQSQPKLNDFGLTKDLASDEVDLTASGTSMGTPVYMSPEQAMGQPERRSDIYSLGVVLYEMLTGRPPFVGNTASLLVQHATAKPPSPQQFVPHLPPQIESVLFRVLAKQPADRYNTATEFSQAFDQACQQWHERGAALAEDDEATRPFQILQSSTPFPRTLPREAPDPKPIAPVSISSQAAPLPLEVIEEPAPLISNNLPLQLTSFVGREEELAQAKLLLQSTRLLTLTGAGGTGKTRLSLQIAAELLDKFPDGAWFVELAPLTEPALVAQELATVLDLREEAGRPLLTTLTNHLRDKQALVILDNCEHLIAACARLSETLLKTCPKLRILASSREGMSIGGETTWRVPSLALPDPRQFVGGGADLAAKLGHYAAVQLFIDRALAVQPNFKVTNQNAAAVAQICYQLDGIPLALELAAARVKAMTVEQIASRLDNRFRLLTGGSRTALPRQQTLRALIDWGYELLTAAEQVLLQRLSVFAGGWTLEAAEAICPGAYDGNELEDFDVLDLLAQLVSKSLVVTDEHDGDTRYRLLVTIRQYGREKLDERGDAAQYLAKHCQLYLELAQKAEPELGGAKQAEWLTQLETEHDNLRSGLNWALEENQAEKALQLSGSLARFWNVRGYMSEGRKWLDAALEKATETGLTESALKAKVLRVAGVTATLQGEFEAARELWEQSMSILQQAGDKAGAALVRNNLAILARRQGNYATARTLYEASLAQFRELGDQRATGQLLNNLGLLMHYQGSYEEARRYLEESLKIYRGLKDQWNVANTLDSLGEVALAQGGLAESHKFLIESLTIYQKLGDQAAIALLLEHFGGLAAAQQQSERALRLAGAGAALRTLIGVPLSPDEETVLERLLKPARQTLPEIAQIAAWNEGQAMAAAEAIAFALKG